MASQKPIVIKDTSSAKRAVLRVINQDDLRGGESVKGISARKVAPTTVAVFLPAGTRRYTLDRVIKTIGGGHVLKAQPAKNQPARLAIGFDVPQAS